MDPYQLGQVLIVAPEVSFEALDRGLTSLGFQRDPAMDAATPALLPGEPEVAGWTWRGDKPFLTYTFNPVVQLRVLDVGMVPPAMRGKIAETITLTPPPQVRLGLQAPDARGRLRALWAAGETERLDLIPATKAMEQDREDMVAKAAAQVTAQLERTVEARLGVLGNLRLLAEGAKSFISRLSEGAFVDRLAPRKEELPFLFDEALADALAPALLAEWSRPPTIDPGGDYSTVKITAATAGLLRFPNELSDAFPRGYRDIAPWMEPSRVWLAWTWSNARGGAIRYDGLVWLDDHWVWVPKAFRLLAPILRPRFEDAGPTVH